ncbi:hypothetical protein [Pseudofrankia sp. BMG5.37]|uniref:hypothetical protein n=1 Tax=Pseudofrankia sp. BMG5.37 TaxID=3050035 RepID=UPI002893B4FA|nr:hypothetical protein [Pseudofrankia sp. BMG5.37]MDT3446032.1 hypothetical protein [Pseudofrankia sp. BMG5.37]
MLEHRYGALLLSGLLTGGPLPELGDDVTPQTIAFQASSFSPVDDIVISGITAAQEERRVSIGVRRDPSFVPSDRATVQLIASYLQMLDRHWPPIASGQWRLALAVASRNAHVGQIAELATFARDAASSDEFRDKLVLVNKDVRQRLLYLDEVVAAASETVPVEFDVTPGDLTWRLLSALRVREIRLEGVDETDRTHAIGQLRLSTASGTVAAADRLFSRLVELAGRYAPASATKNLATLYRDLSGYDLAPAGPIGNAFNAAHTRPLVRSEYLERVKEIAPAKLQARDRELAAMAEFALGAGSSPFLCWRADAWAGKSALMSTFALNPPDGVRVACFFITARQPGQNNRVGFSEVVLEQLLELLGEPMPMLLTDSTRDAHFAGALARAAQFCSHSGERLILLVDGLDEDQGVTADADFHSIASLLPADPPNGMRVIVSGRPNPPIPPDVPEIHPLRGDGTVRVLPASPYADVARRDAERELKRLLRGAPAERDLLGLLTASGGGLSSADLAELAGLPSWEIDDLLGAASGRSFAIRAGHWLPDSAVYVLGHEELQQQAVRFLGEVELRRHGARLHDWADGYRERGWPAGSPEYLLRDYFQFVAGERDLRRVLLLAIDANRHDRMLDIAGGDAAAFAEIETAQQLFLGEPRPDLEAMVKLAFHRDQIARRNDFVPADLPQVWALLGQYERAESLAFSIKDPYRQVQALAAIAREAVSVGEERRSYDLRVRAERLIPSIPNILEQCRSYADVARAAALAHDVGRADTLISTAFGMIDTLSEAQRPLASADVARAWAAMGELNKAKELALSIENWMERSRALALVAGEVGRLGLFLTALAVAETIDDRPLRAEGLSAIARAMTAAGDTSEVAGLIQKAEKLAGAIRHPYRQAWTLAVVAHAVAESGDVAQAMTIVHRVVRLAARPGKQKHRTPCLIAAARVAAMCGEVDYAEAMVVGVPGGVHRAQASTAIAAGIAKGGQDRSAEAAVRKAELVARSAGGGPEYDDELLTLTRVATQVGCVDLAEKVARSIADESQRDLAIFLVADAVATSGDVDRAERISASIRNRGEAAKKAATGISDAIGNNVEVDRRRSGTQLAPNLLGGGKIFGATDEPRPKTGAPQSGPVNTSYSSDSDENDELHNRVTADVAVEHATAKPFAQAKILTQAAREAVQEQDFERANRILSTITNEQLRASAFAMVAEEVAWREGTEQAQLLLERSIAAIDAIAAATRRDPAIASVVGVLTRLGWQIRARQLAQSVVDPAYRARALTSVAAAAATRGDIILAESIAAEFTDPETKDKILASIVQSCASRRDLQGAERIAQKITHPGPRARAIHALAQTAGEIGDVERAMRAIESIPNVVGQAEALIALAQSAPRSVALRLVAEALHRGHWRISLPTVGRIEPDAVRSFLKADITL